MKIVTEDLWKPCDCWVVTTNSILKRNGALVMGRGAAYEAIEKFPGIDMECGKAIKANDADRKVYGFRLINAHFGIFQTKVNWWDNAEIKVIEYSIKMLAKEARAYPKLRYRLNFPGIGCGGLLNKDVVGFLEILPDNVTVCMR
jgi:hypothetical protein